MGAVIYTAALIFAVTAEAADQVTVSTLDGRQLAGRVASWSDGRLRLVTTDGEQELAHQGLVSVRFSASSKAPAETPPRVELTDGSTIPIADYTVHNQVAVLLLDARSSPAGRRLQVPLDSITAVSLVPMAADPRSQWNNIRQLALPSDVLVVHRQAGGHLDHLEGVVGDVTESSVDFTYDGESMSVDRSKVAGLMYYRPHGTRNDIATVVAHGRNGLRFHVTDIELKDNVWHLQSAGGVKMDVPAAELHWFDFSGGKVIYVNDLEPIAVEWTPLIGLPASASLVKSFGQPRFGTSYFGGPLSLELSKEDSVRTRRKTYAHGISLRSRTDITFAVPRGFRRFSALAGIEPEVRRQGRVQLSIAADDETLLETPLTGEDQPLEVDLDVAGKRRLHIRVDYGENLDTGDLVNLCDAKFTK